MAISERRSGQRDVLEQAAPGCRPAPTSCAGSVSQATVSEMSVHQAARGSHGAASRSGARPRA